MLSADPGQKVQLPALAGKEDDLPARAVQIAQRLFEPFVIIHDKRLIQHRGDARSARQQLSGSQPQGKINLLHGPVADLADLKQMVPGADPQLHAFIQADAVIAPFRQRAEQFRNPAAEAASRFMVDSA